jgi:tetratricopeptide (TPR) repeat protein
LACYEQAATWEPDNEVYVVGYRTALAAAEGGQPATTAKRPGNPHPEAIGPAAYAGRAEVSDLPPANTLFDKGRAALAEGSLETARAYFQEAAAISPDNPQIPISAAVTALRYRQPALAIELLAPVRECPSASARVHRILGVAYYRLGDYRSSQVAIQQALSLDKLSALSYFLMGCTLAKLGQFESAEAHWQQARTIDPRYAVHR